MSDVELIIKIPEEVYKNIQSKSTEIQAKGYTVENAVLNGIPLEQIRAEIIELYNDRQNTQDSERTKFFRKVLDIFDKYRGDANDNN